MPVTPTYPGVYIEEIPSGVRTITGVSTSIAAFIDFFKRGPMNKAVQIFNMGDFEREFGGLDARSEASYGIQQFFLNGGTEAWVVRVASGSVAAVDVQIDDVIPAAASALTVTAISEGTWGNILRVRVDNNVPTAGEFNLIISEVATVGTRPTLVRQEIFRNLSMDNTRTNFVQTVVNDQNTGSKLVRVTASGTNSPLANGTLSREHTSPPTIPASPAVSVTIGTGGAADVTRTATLILPSSITLPNAQPLTTIAPILEAAIRAAAPANPAFSEATVDVISRVDSSGNVIGRRLRVMAGPGDARTRVRFATIPGNATATNLLLTSGPVNLTATLSDIHAVNPNIPASPQIDVTIGGTTATATLSFPAATVLPGPVPLADIAPVLEAAIRTAVASNPLFNDAVVRVAGNRLVILPGGTATANQVTFANTGGDTTADALLLTSGPVNLTATLSDIHAVDPNIPASPQIDVTIGGMTATATLSFPAATVLPGPVPLADIAPVLEAAIRSAVASNPLFNDAVVRVAGNRLVILPGGTATANQVTFANTGASQAAAALLLTTVATANLQEYTPGGGPVADTAQLNGTAGNDGAPPDGAALIGDLASKRGIYALEDVDLFNLLCLPRTAIVSNSPTAGELTPTEARAVLTVAQTYCEKRRAFFLVDTPTGIDEPQEIKTTLTNDIPRHRNAALYYPRVRIPDPLNNFRLRSVGASGTIAGLCARIDSSRGVWKAPAGTEATLRNVSKLDDVLTDPENGTLNPLAINCLRTFPVYGSVCWGARTLDGSDQQTSEWKYIPVRRVALFIEESLYRGTQWVVFEPNDEPLWAQIRLNIGAFMHNLFRQGAFQGKTPREAYLVKCDKETTTQNDINLGIVNILVGFAPLKPAEFVFIQIQQLAGQIEA